MLLLSGLCGLRHGLVERLDAISQCLQLFGECGNGLRCIRDRGIEVLERLAKLFDLIVSGVELPLTIFLLVVIVQLLLAQDSNKVINEREDLLEAHLAARERHGDEVQSCLAALLCSHAQALHHGRSLPPLTLTICNQLQEAGAWQGLLEEFEGVVIVQDLDCLSNGDLLLSPHLLNLIPLLVLCCAVLIHVCQELLILTQSFLRVLEVIGHVGDIHTQLANAHGLILNGSSVSSELLLLCCHQLGLSLLCICLSTSDGLKVLAHLILHHLQDAYNLAAGWRIATVASLVQVRHEDVSVWPLQLL
mmetsp:Transcript_39510/g.88437  ORF Transcript_39510/g.88437 Transcript_39510/m.88437 type:complete len:305 (+) Transcript_39510:854-1768(+)